MKFNTRSLVLCLSVAGLTVLQTVSAMPPPIQNKKICDDANARAVEPQTGTGGALISEKKNRTPAQKKIDSQLLYALKQRRGETRGVPTGRINLQLDERGHTLVDISAKISPALISEIERLGGAVISQSERYNTVRASLALEKLEALASLKDVRFIAPVVKPITHGAQKN